MVFFTLVERKIPAGSGAHAFSLTSDSFAKQADFDFAVGGWTAIVLAAKDIFLRPGEGTWRNQLT